MTLPQITKLRYGTITLRTGIRCESRHMNEITIIAETAGLVVAQTVMLSYMPTMSSRYLLEGITLLAIYIHCVRHATVLFTIT